MQPQLPLRLLGWILFGTLLLISPSGCSTTNDSLLRGKTTIRGPEVIAIKSHNSVAYRQVITAFSIASRAPVTEYNLEKNPARALQLLQLLRKKRPALLLTLGAFATQQFYKKIPRTPLLFALVPQHKKIIPANDTNTIGITITRSIRYQFLTIQKLAPKTKTVGVIYNPRYSQKLVRNAQREIKSLGMKLIAAKVDNNEDVNEAIRLFEGQVDALWQIPDPSIEQSFQALLRFTFRSKIPFFTLSEKFVQEGSLVSTGLDYPAIGQQAGAMSNSLLFQGSSLSSIGIQSPKQLRISLNLTTSQRIGVTCDITLQVLKYAAQNQFPLRIYK